MTTSTLLDALRAGTAALPLLLAGTAIAQPDVEVVDGVEADDDAEQMPRLALNEMQMGTFEQGDLTTDQGHLIDGFEVELTAGRHYRLEIAGQGFVALVYLVNVDGTLIEGLAFEADQTGITFTAPRTGVYSVGTMTQTPGDSGMYMVGFGESDRAPSPVAGQDFPVNVPGQQPAGEDTADDAEGRGDGQVHDINVPNDAQQINATLDQDDLKTEEGKYFAFLSMDLAAGETFHFHIDAGFPVMLNMQDNDGNNVEINGVGLDGRYINMTAPADGNYSLLIVGLEPERGGDYTVSAWQGEPVFAEGDPRTTPRRDNTGHNEGVQMIQDQLDTDDTLLDDGRYFAFHTVELSAGVTYDIDIASDAVDVIGYLFDAENNQLDTNDDAPEMGTNARITFTPDAAGSYSVGVSTVKPGRTGGYQVTVTPRGGVAPDDNTGPAAQEHSILFDANGQADDESTYYAGDFRLEAGQHVVIQTYGLSDGCDTVLQLRRSTDPDAVHADDPVLAENDDYDGMLHSRIVFTAEEAGDYYLAVGVYEGAAGTFGVVVREALPTPDPVVIEGVEIEKDGQVLLGDFQVEQGLNWIVVETADLQMGVDTVIELRKTVDPERASDDDPVIATNDDFFGNDLRSRVYFQCEESGLYYVRITNIGKNAGTCSFILRYEE